MFKNNNSQIYESKKTKFFGKLPNGEEVQSISLMNSNGMECTIISYGATITSLKIPTVKAEPIDVVLGFETLEDYYNSFDLPSAPFFGAVVGRYAGRINNASFTLNDKKIELTKNWKVHQLHGGFENFSKKNWTFTKHTESKNPSATLEYISLNNEENFPGELTVKITYQLTDDNALKVIFSAHSSEDTICNLTQHSYFNLDGHANDVSNQKLKIYADKILETSEELIPTGNYIDLKNLSFDFSEFKKCPTFIDTTFVLKTAKAIELYSETTRLKMTVSTNQPAVHVYIGGNCFGKINGKENAAYHTQSGICFETQNFPDAPNHTHFPSPILKKGTEYQNETIFKFENL